MRTPSKKSTVDEIRARFDADVERFSNIETGQSATVDAALALELVAKAAQAATPHAGRLLDIGCGAGNFSLRLMQQLPGVRNVTLIDLSQPMLDRAVQRVTEAGAACRVQAHPIQGDVRDLTLPARRFDVVVAAAVLHHLRTDAQWQAVFAKVYDAVTPGGSFWIFDLVTAEHPAINVMMWQRYGRYLAELRDEAYREHVMAYIEKEDTPRPLMEQLDRLRSAGFEQVDVLHKNTCFAAFGGVKPE